MRKRRVYVCANCEQEFAEIPSRPMVRGRVFLSYGHDPACEAIVRRIEIDLRTRGWTPWLDTHRIEFGDDWRSEITRGIQQSQHVLAFLSAHSTRKPGVCRQEVAIALGPGKCHVYTILVEPLSLCRPPLIISHRQWLDMQTWRDLQASDPVEFESLYQRSLSAIIRVLERNEPFAGEIDELYSRLRPIDSTADMVAAEERFVGREWLLGGIAETGDLQAATVDPVGDIESWRIAGDSNKIFWISAQPGWGKSAVAARLAHAGRARVLAVHFCRRGEARTVDARCVVRTIAYQIATQLPEFRSLLLARIRADEQLDGLSADELFSVLLKQPLQYVIQADRNAHDRQLIVIDGLDEALDQHGQSPLLDVISEGFAELPDWLGLVVTSRPEAPIARRLAQFGIRHVEAADQRNRDDLTAYAASWLARIGVDRAGYDQALGSVLAAAAGNFLYLRQLERSVSNGVIAIEALVGRTGLPPGLGGLYSSWFARKFSDADSYAANQRPLLELVAASEEPLSVARVTRILAWGAYDERKVLEPLDSLCPSDERGLRFFHKSLSDWLTNADLAGPLWHVSIAEGHNRLTRYLDHCLSTNDQAWEGDYYLCRYGAVHAAKAGRPYIGARLLVRMTHPQSRVTIARRHIRAATDDYLLVLGGCQTLELAQIASADLAQLISRTDTRDALAVACDILLSRKPEWGTVFTEHPLDGRGATWTFASRWARHILSMPASAAQQEWRSLNEIAVDSSHPLFLPAAYAFKYVALQRREWIDTGALRPYCTGGPYTRLVATNLLLQFALQTGQQPCVIPWPEFWYPVWDYNRIEVGLLVGAMRWRGISSDHPLAKDKAGLFSKIETERLRLAGSAQISGEASAALDFFWQAGVDPERCNSLLKVLDLSTFSNEILELFLASPIFEAAEVAAAILADRESGRPDAIVKFVELADPESVHAWGGFAAAVRLTTLKGDASAFATVIERYSLAKDAQLRGLAAMNLASYLRDCNGDERIRCCHQFEHVIRTFLHDTDIWPVQEMFHLLKELDYELGRNGFDWVSRFSVSESPVIGSVVGWEQTGCDWQSFESRATVARSRVVL